MRKLLKKLLEWIDGLFSQTKGLAPIEPIEQMSKHSVRLIKNGIVKGVAKSDMAFAFRDGAPITVDYQGNETVLVGSPGVYSEVTVASAADVQIPSGRSVVFAVLGAISTYEPPLFLGTDKPLLGDRVTLYTEEAGDLGIIAAGSYVWNIQTNAWDNDFQISVTAKGSITFEVVDITAAGAVAGSNDLGWMLLQHPA